jgi:hypothetical protein
MCHGHRFSPAAQSLRHIVDINIFVSDYINVRVVLAVIGLKS